MKPVFNTTVIGDHPLNKNFEYVQFNPDLLLIRCKTDGLYQAKSIPEALQSDYKTRYWFKEKRNQEKLKQFMKTNNIKNESIIHDVKMNVPEPLQGHYINEQFIYPIAFDCDQIYKAEFLRKFYEWKSQNPDMK